MLHTARLRVAGGCFQDCGGWIEIVTPLSPFPICSFISVRYFRCIIPPRSFSVQLQDLAGFLHAHVLFCSSLNIPIWSFYLDSLGAQGWWVQLSMKFLPLRWACAGVKLALLRLII